MPSRCSSGSACRTKSTSSRRIARRCGWRSSRKAPRARGIEVIIAGAGGAAHLPGMVAAHTVLPVLGVPVQSAALNGLDSLLSIVQMPGGVPVGTLAIGKAGATNAGLLAVAILATSRPDLREKLRAFRAEQTAQGPRGHACREPRHPARGRPSGCWAAGSWAACSPSPPGGWATASTRSRRARTRPPARSPTSRSPPTTRTSTRSARSRRACTWSRSSSRTCPTEAAAAAAEFVPVRPSGAALHITQQRAREKAFLADHGFPVTPCAAVHTLDELAVALGSIGTPAILKTAASATTARASTASRRSRTPSASGD